LSKMLAILKHLCIKCFKNMAFQKKIRPYILLIKTDKNCFHKIVPSSWARCDGHCLIHLVNRPIF
jgi:hypothetical protein